MQIKVITLFPKMFDSPFAESMIKRAKEKGIIDLKIYNLRDWAVDNYGSVDDHPYGGGVGMLLRPEPVYEALKKIKDKGRIILLTAGGKKFNQKKAEELSKLKEITLICGHYEGFDQRVHDKMVDEELSIGSYILTGGELPAMVVIDAIARLLPGVLGKDESNKSESYSVIEIDGKKRRIKEYPQYTRPYEFRGWKVPDELLSGDPKKIKEWRLKKIRDSRFKVKY